MEGRLAICQNNRSLHGLVDSHAIESYGIEYGASSEKVGGISIAYTRVSKRVFKVFVIVLFEISDGKISGSLLD